MTLAQMLAAIRDALAGLAGDSAGTAVLVLGAVAAITMAILQIIKDVTPLRRIYQRWWMSTWITQQAAGFGALHNNAKANPAKAAMALVELTTGGLADAFYDLSPEDMELQANAAGQIVLDEPSRYPDLLFVLSVGAAWEDLDRVGPGQPKAGSTQEYFEARSRLVRRMARNLQGARLALSNRWKLWMQLAALLLTTLLVEAVVVSSRPSDGVTYVLAIPVGLVGGYLAPVARDLLAALQRLRGGTS